MIVRFSSRFNAELKAIGRWIAKDNPYRAETYVQEMRAACEAIGQIPELYPFASDNHLLQRKLFAPYLIFYRVRRGEVLIVSIRRGRRDNRALR